MTKERRKSTSLIKILTNDNCYLFTNFVIINNLYNALKKMLVSLQVVKSEEFEIVSVDTNKIRENSISDSSTISFISLNQDLNEKLAEVKTSNHETGTFFFLLF
jgi:hypothetical protein